ncbi:unnamed protein product [Schistosoma rodhaini]|uniref:Collagenase NC10/endostatin domain-containing protein n=1 Tax=Schistosoma rodhaini TaxID=6188 RepID=A0AA85EZV8_9TREM|nr:unnamed protein product [Schistosoma rodhaini]
MTEVMIKNSIVKSYKLNYILTLTLTVSIILPRVFSEQGVNWDITYLLNRRYDIARADEDFPIKIQPPSGDVLYSVPALRLFPQSKLPDETFFIHLIFKPNKTAIQHGLYLFSIRDPDNVLRLGLKIIEYTTYQIIFTYNPLSFDGNSKEVEFSIPWNDDYWHLGILIKPDKIYFYTSCEETQGIAYHFYSIQGLLGEPLFRKGATFYALNSGLKNASEYFEGYLKAFSFHSDENALQYMCTKSENYGGSGDADRFKYDPEFGNILITSSIQDDEEQPEEMDLISRDKVEKITNASSCECIEDLFRRGLLRLKGEKGDRGDPGPMGPEGPPGTCPATCGSNLSTVIQGLKGDPGPPGFCTIDQCKEAAIPGPQGPPGEKGEKGDPGEVDLTSDQSISVIKQAIHDFILQPEIQKQFRGPKGDPGECSCLSDAADNPSPKKDSNNELNNFKNNHNTKSNNNGEILGYGAMVLNTEMDLSKVSHTFPVGTMAYIREADTFYLKTMEQTNTWRIINLLSKADAINLPIPKPTPAPVFEPQYYPVHKGKKLYLIAQNEPLRGDLKYNDRITGAHAGSIFACQRAANLKGLGRAFYPLLSTDMFNMDYVVPPTYRYGVPLVNLHGEILFDDFMSLVEGRSKPQAKLLNFDGVDITDDIVAPCLWIGQKPIYLNGDYEFAAQSKCRNWQSTYPGENGLAVSLPIVDNAPGLFSKQNFKLISCSKFCRMLCIQITPSDK